MSIANLDDDGPTPAGGSAVADHSGPASDWYSARWASGTEAPGELVVGSGPRTSRRSFGFLDMCGSTSFLEAAGPRAAVDAVTEFRAAVREISARRGVRVAKWLGDGAMLVGVTPGPVIAACVETCSTGVRGPLGVRAGVAVSDALLFDGDDYIAPGANLASRICDAAEAGETLCDRDCEIDVASWITVDGDRDVAVRGMGRRNVLVLTYQA